MTSEKINKTFLKQVERKTNFIYLIEGQSNSRGKIIFGCYNWYGILVDKEQFKCEMSSDNLFFSF